MTQKTLVSFTTQNQGDIEFSAPVSQEQAVKDVQATLARHNDDASEAAIWFKAENPVYISDWTTFAKPGNFVSVAGGKVKVY
jgi:hypothetical protein